ncbi:ATP-binding protein [Robertmurraya sp. DFI.2.37]|uniref:ATP-binding protein n=1 Tax=Robertmurraya sp. DFI.2.37 TaxID=3031819 RepID=UPI001247A472|nr:ATP-binding protein [Robertmurraya sp. DFI.2.37]MDF1511263.1 ATP-binding protein [Robertmurraya sp. DFI.2.37]
MKIIELANGTQVQVAEYKEQEILEYQNPLIEALPPIYSQQEVIDLLSIYPPYHREERYLNDYKRIHLLQRILRYYQPLPIHLQIQSSVDCLLRAGYVSRNPLNKNYAQGFVNNWSNIQNKSFDNSVIQTGQTLTIVGIGGVGKTRTLQRIIGMIPQVISHTVYKDKPLNTYQITHLTIQTPFDGSVKTIIFDFMYQIDLLMGTDYFNRYANSRLSTSQLMPITASIAKSANLGLLIIDEVQHLKAVKSKSSTQVLNFFTTLINTVNIPLIMVGTPKAMDILQSQFRQARRNTNAGNVMWNRMEKDDIWDLFVQGMWKYQWTREETPFNEEISSILYDISQGICDICVKIYMMVQLRAITNEEEKITIPLIKQVAKEELKIVQPMLHALRTNNYQKLVDYDDISFPAIENYIERGRIAIKQKEVIESLKQGVDRKNNQSKLVDDAVFRLTILGIDDVVARETVLDIVSMQSQTEELSAIVQQAYRILTDSKASESINNEKDLRRIIEQGKEQELSAYQALYEAGIIKQDYPVGNAS